MPQMHVTLSTDRAPDEISRPDPAKLLLGDPIHTTWLHENRAPLYAGVWRSTPGAWRVQYDEWEYFHVLDGHGTLTETDGTAIPLSPGSRHILRPGFSGIFEVTEPLTKDFVILT
ncbi:MAG: cupin domain-containing protein [Rhodobacteraceae bacterium]|nr:MAG: cupin domain-containing protein [Paracoccaceae bacterium]